MLAGLGTTMPIRCNLKVLIARENLKRAERGDQPVSMRRLADDTGLALSSLALLATNKTQRIDYKTIDKLCVYFGVEVGDLLKRVSGEESEAPA